MAPFFVVSMGGFPPPVTGASKNLELITSDICKLSPDVVRANIARGAVSGRWRLLHRRIARYATACSTLVRFRKRPRRVIYLTSDAGYGMAMTLLTVFVARSVHYDIVLQHRTNHYINQRNFLAAAINRALGSKGLHVFLTDGMARQFFDIYAPRRDFFVNHNLAQCGEFARQVRRVRRRRLTGELQFGYMSNLIPSKGFGTFLDIARQFQSQGVPGHFVLAGPAPSPAEEAVVRQALRELGDRLEWRGAVHGDAKLRFFRDIDVFVFPTRYPYEAQPNVVLEALSAGNYVVAPDRGCIREDLERLGGTCVPREHEASVEIWTDVLADLTRDPAALISARAKSSKAVKAAIRIARGNYEALLHRIAYGRKAAEPTDRG